MSGHAVSFAGTHEVSESHFTIYIYIRVCVYVGYTHMLACLSLNLSKHVVD